MNITIDDQRVWQNIVTLKNHAIEKGLASEDLNTAFLTDQNRPITLSIDSFQSLLDIYTNTDNTNVLFFEKVADTVMKKIERALSYVYMYMLNSQEKLGNNAEDTVNKRVVAASFALPLIDLYSQQFNKMLTALNNEKLAQGDRERNIIETKEKEIQTKEKEIQTKEKEIQTKEKEIKIKEEVIETRNKIIIGSGFLIASLTGIILYLLVYKK